MKGLHGVLWGSLEFSGGLSGLALAWLRPTFQGLVKAWISLEGISIGYRGLNVMRSHCDRIAFKFGQRSS